MRLVFEHEAEHESQLEAIGSLAAKIRRTAETPRKRVRRAECDQGRRAGVSSFILSSAPPTSRGLRSCSPFFFLRG